MSALNNAMVPDEDLKELVRSKDRFQLLQQATHDAIYDWDLTTDTFYWNENTGIMFRYSMDAITQDLNWWREKVHPDDREEVVGSLLETIANGKNFWAREYRFLRGDGTYCYVIDRGYITHDPQGQPIRMIGAMLDITDRKIAEKLLAEREYRFRSMVNSAPFFIIMSDRQYFYFNRAWQVFTGIHHDILHGHWWFARAIHPDDRKHCFQQYRMAKKNEQESDFEFRLRRNDGKYRWIHAIGVPRYCQENGLIGFIGAGIDVTERKLYREELEHIVEERTRELETLNHELESFSYSISHDLRAPLRVLNGFSQAILDMYGEKLDNRGKDYLNRIMAGSQHMGQLIDDILKLSRLTREELNVIDDIDLSQLAQGIFEELQEHDPHRQVNILIQKDMKARGDKRLLQIALQNLISNAWKYTSKHSSANIQFGQLEEDGVQVFYIYDDGAGFNMEYANQLFGPFQRLHRHDEFPGNGIGLAIVARIIHRHNGDIWAKGEVEKGATFYFTLTPSNIKEKYASQLV